MSPPCCSPWKRPQTLNDALSNMQHGTYIAPSRQTLTAFLNQWVEGTRTEPALTAWTAYRDIIRRWIKPQLGGTRLVELTPMEIKAWHAVLLDHGGACGRPLSLRFVQFAHRVLHRALADAVRTHGDKAAHQVPLTTHESQATAGPRLATPFAATTNVAVLNHTIVPARDKVAAATFMTEILGLDPPTSLGPFAVVQVSADTTLDFIDVDDEIVSQHYAFLVTESEFDEIFGRLRERDLPYWSDPGKNEPGQINGWDDGLGVYFDDPDGHLLEIITRPYGSGGTTASNPHPLIAPTLEPG